MAKSSVFKARLKAVTV